MATDIQCGSESAVFYHLSMYLLGSQCDRNGRILHLALTCRPSVDSGQVQRGLLNWNLSVKLQSFVSTWLWSVCCVSDVFHDGVTSSHTCKILQLSLIIFLLSYYKVCSKRTCMYVNE